MSSTSSPTLEEGIVRIHTFTKDNSRELGQLTFLFPQLFPFASISLAGSFAISTFLKNITKDPHGILLYDSEQKGIAVGSTHLQSTLYSLLVSTSARAWFAGILIALKNPALVILRGIWLIRTPKSQCGYVRFLQVQDEPESASVLTEESNQTVVVNADRRVIMRKYALIGSMEREFKLADCRQVWVELPRQQEDDLEAYLLRGYSLVDRGFKRYLLRKIFYA